MEIHQIEKFHSNTICCKEYTIYDKEHPYDSNINGLLHKEYLYTLDFS